MVEPQVNTVLWPDDFSTAGLDEEQWATYRRRCGAPTVEPVESTVEAKVPLQQEETAAPRRARVAPNPPQAKDV
jgi:hypothetical protein